MHTIGCREGKPGLQTSYFQLLCQTITNGGSAKHCKHTNTALFAMNTQPAFPVKSVDGEASNSSPKRHPVEEQQTATEVTLVLKKSIFQQ